jgi:chromate transporter
MAVVAAQLAHSTLIDVPTVAIAIVSAGLLARFRINSAWLVLAGALIGAALEAAR